MKSWKEMDYNDKEYVVFVLLIMLLCGVVGGIGIYKSVIENRFYLYSLLMIGEYVMPFIYIKSMEAKRE